MQVMGSTAGTRFCKGLKSCCSRAFPVTGVTTLYVSKPRFRGTTVRISAVGPGRDQQQQEEYVGQAEPSVKQEDIIRRRLRFGERPTGRPRKRPAKQSTDFDPDDPSSLLPFLSERWRRFARACSHTAGRLQYKYFNWRQDTSNELMLIFALFASFLLVGGGIRHWLIDNDMERLAGGFWNDLYMVCQWVFGQEFPATDSPAAQRVFAVVTAMVGLCAFALVLALVEQVVLEAMEVNVKRGSKVYESGHVLILGWCVSQRDLEVVRKVLQQICVAYKPEGGTQVVVLTERSKLEMEGIFRRTLPESKRYRTQLVFRQGSPLVPSDLKLVAASKARSTVIVSDQSRSAAEADAQSLRCAILLDELDMISEGCDASSWISTLPGSAAGGSASSSSGDELVGSQIFQDVAGQGRQVVVELKTSNALPLLKYACSSRTIALPTGQLNAQRLAKMVKRPVISIVSQQLFNFENGVSMFVHYYPHLVGRRFGDLAYLFPDGIVMGLVDRITKKTRMAPSKDYIVLSSQALVMLRPTHIKSHNYHPLKQAPDMAHLLHSSDSNVCQWVRRQGKALYGNAQLHPHAELFPASAYTATASTASGTTINAEAGGYSSYEGFPAAEDWSRAGVSQVEALRLQVEANSLYADGQQTIAAADNAAAHTSSGKVMEQNNIVAANISNRIDANSLAGVTRMAAASSLVAVNAEFSIDRSKSRMDVRPYAIQTVAATATAKTGGSSSNSSNGHAASSNANPLSTADWPVLSGVRDHHRPHGSWHLPNLNKLDWQQYQQYLPVHIGDATAAAVVAAARAASIKRAGKVASAKPSGAAPKDPTLLVPAEYLQVDEGPERVLVLGWGPNSLMLDLLKELDHGLSALPSGSDVVFANTHNPDESLGAVLQHATLTNLKVRHVHTNPLLRTSLASKLDVSAYRCAVVLCDELWVDPDSNDLNGIDNVDEPSVLRLDSLVMVTQLNIRKLLEDSRLPPINIICQKVATEGLTRFEDRNRLPLGISVNLNSFSAKMLTQIAVNPLMLRPVTRLGEDAQLTIVDSGAYAGLNESINFWQLVSRCQEVGEVLLGYYAIPDHVDEPLQTVVDPLGMEERCEPRVWTNGDGRLKFIVLRGIHNNHHGGSGGSVDDLELENTQRAHWVVAHGQSGTGGDEGGKGEGTGSSHAQ